MNSSTDTIASGTQTDFRLEETTIADIHRAMSAGELTSRALTEAYLRRIEAYDQQGPELNSVVTINEHALERADEMDAELARTGKLSGPLHGIPMLVKDCIETNDILTSFGSEVFADYQPRNDATVVANLRAAGAVIIGKTTLPDFATSWWAYSSRSGETKNPYALAHDPGGSSGGTGASISANFATVGLGTDCGGSIRVPASFDNLVGVRSTPGLVSRYGVGCLVFYQDTIGPMARTVEDAARVMDVLVGYDEKDSLTYHYPIAKAPKSYTESLVPDALKGARIGLVTNALGRDDDENEGPVNKVIRDAVEVLKGAGAEVVEVEIPNLMDHLMATSLYVARTKYDINQFLAERPDAPIRTLQEIHEKKRYHPALDLLEACIVGPDDPTTDPTYHAMLTAREAFTRAVVNVMAENNLEALTFPSVQVAPPSREQLATKVWTTLTFPTNTLIASQAWLPAIVVPAGFTEAGLPVGIEFVALPYDEPTVFRLGYGFEQATHHRQPPRSAPALG